jgi:hypothetical protein
MKFKLFSIKSDGNGFVVNDYYTNIPTPKYENRTHAINLCRLRLGKTIHDDLHQVKLPFTNMWVVW